MAAEDRMIFDKTEICFGDYSGKRFQRYHITYDMFVSISIDNCMTRKLFKKIPDQCISMRLRGRETPLKLLKSQDEEHFDEYVEKMEKFAKINKLTFYKNI